VASNLPRTLSLTLNAILRLSVKMDFVTFSGRVDVHKWGAGDARIVLPLEIHLKSLRARFFG
jgi:hypothetical protein